MVPDPTASPEVLARGVRTSLNKGEKLISGSYTPSSDCNVLSAKRTLSRDTSMSLLLCSARRIASLRVSVTSPPSTPTRVRSGAGGTWSGRDLSNGSLRRSWSGSGDFVIGSCAIAASLSRNKHGSRANEITLSNILIRTNLQSASWPVEVVGYSLECSFEHRSGQPGCVLAHPPASRQLH